MTGYHLGIYAITFIRLSMIGRHYAMPMGIVPLLVSEPLAMHQYGRYAMLYSLASL